MVCSVKMATTYESPCLDSSGDNSAVEQDGLRQVYEFTRPKIILVSGPKGAGKREIAQLLEIQKYGVVIKKHTTRRPSDSPLPWGIDETLLFTFVSPTEFESLEQQGEFRFITQSQDHRYGIHQKSLEEALGDSSLHTLSLASGYSSFQDHYKFFNKVAKNHPNKPTLVSVLIYSTQRDLQDSVLKSQELVTSQMLHDYAKKCQTLLRHQDEFDYIIRNPLPFGYLLRDEKAQITHSEYINRTTLLFGKILEWEKSEQRNPNDSIAHNHKRFVNHLISTIFSKSTEEVSSSLENNHLEIRFTEGERESYAQSKRYPKSSIPQEVRIRAMHRSYGIWTMYISSKMGAESRNMTLDMIARRAGMIYAQRIPQEDSTLLAPLSQITELGRTKTNAMIHEGGLFSLRDVIAKQHNAPVYAVNIAFIYNLPRHQQLQCTP